MSRTQPLIIILLLVFLRDPFAFAGEVQDSGEPTENPTISDIQVGFAGDFKLGFWTPVKIRLKGGNSKSAVVVTVDVRDGDGLLSRFTTNPEKPIRLEPDRSAVANLTVKFGRPTGQILVRLVTEDREIAKRAFSYGESSSDNVRRAWSADDELLLLVGPEIGLAKAVDNSRRAQLRGRTTHVARLPDSTSLPTEWFAYQGVDTLFLAASEPVVFESLLKNERQAAALRLWIEQGGRLFLFVSRQAPQALAADSPLARLAPGPLGEFQELRNTRELEDYCKTEYPVRLDNLKTPLQVPQLDEIHGAIDVSVLGEVGRIPLIVRRPLGLGQVVYVALDMDQPPLSNWLGRSRFFRRLLERSLSSSDAERSHADQQFRTLGYHDLSGQLHAALDVFPSARVIPFSLVIALILVYVALIGPGDFFFLKRVVGRLEWTWLTFSCLVICVAAVSIWIAYSWKSDLTQINQIELIDIDLESEQLRGAYWGNIYNPRSSSLDLKLDPRAFGQEPSDAAATRLAWLGIPGRGLGGMQSQANQPGPANPYLFAHSLDGLSDVPLASWSAKAFAGQWNDNRPTGLEVELSHAPDDKVRGTIANHTGVDLIDCRLFYSRWIYKLPDLPHTAVQVLDQKLTPGSLRGALTSTPYAQSGSDAANILNSIMFHKTAGGESFTRLSNHYQSRLDLTDHLILGRAILIAQVAPHKTADSADSNQAKSPESSVLLLNGEPLPGTQVNQQTIYRFVLPVQSTKNQKMTKTTRR